MSTVNRSLRPLPPAGASAVYVSGSGTTVSWKNRNRTILRVVKQSDVTQTPEDGQTTKIEIYDDALDLIHTETGVTGTSFFYDEDDEIADAGSIQDTLTFILTSERDGYESLYSNTTETLRIDRVVVGADTVTFEGDRVII